MPTSDSEGFESADEGGGTFEKKQRKRSTSSSCYSDNAVETEAEAKKAPAVTAPKEKPKKEVAKSGWDNFNIEESEPVACIGVNLPSLSKSTEPDSEIKEGHTTLKPKEAGWEDFDDWSDDNVVDNITKSQPKPRDDKDMEKITQRMAATATTPTSSGWGWGWGVDSLLNTATAGFNSISNQMSQGISTVLETGLGAPDPEELAKKSMKQQGDSPEDLEVEPQGVVDDKTDDKAPLIGDGDGAFGGFAPLGSLLKFVGSAGSKVLHGGLDTLETIGRKAMDVLQEHDPNLRKKRELLGLEPSVPVLSQVLREAKEKAEAEDRIREEKQEAKEVHYENLFDDFGGLVHLEALELLSKRCHFRIEEILRDAPPDRKSDIKDTLLMVAHLCELPDENDEDGMNVLEEQKKLATMRRHETMHPADVLLEKLQKATEDLAIKIQFQPLVNQFSELLKYFDNKENDFSQKTLIKRAVSSLAEATSLALEIYHKTAELLLVTERRMVADESDALTQMTTILSGHFADIANAYVAKLTEGDSFVLNENVRAKVTHIYLVANDSASYVQNALLMMHTVLQVGAIA